MIVYTSIFNNNDRLPEPLIKNKNIEYICFTDGLKRSKKSIWKIKTVDGIYDGTRNNRYYKINSHLFFPSEEIVLYLDPTFLIIKDFYNKIEEWLGDKDIAIRPHPKRKSIYEEAEYLINNKPHKIDSKELIIKQMNMLKNEDYPESEPLCEGGFIIRRNTEQVKKFNEMWWNIVKNYSKRDQLSFNYVSWKLGIGYNLIERKEVEEYTRRIAWHP